MPPKIAPYGSWNSPLTASLLAETGVSLGQVRISDGDIYWIEGRPREGGRCVIVRQRADGTIDDLLPQGFNCRTRVHEYGGGSLFVYRDNVYFSNFDDQRLYRFRPGEAPVAMTPEPSSKAAVRFADLDAASERGLIFCVRERHTEEGEPKNDIVLLKGTGVETSTSVVSGGDFYSNPRVSPDGKQLAWLTWNHPNMPWDGTELWLGELDEEGVVQSARRITGGGITGGGITGGGITGGGITGGGITGGGITGGGVAGGERESVFQPLWSPDGVLHFVSDITGWWNLYSLAFDGDGNCEAGEIEALAPMEAEFGAAQWVFGMSRYTFLNDGRLVCSYSQGGIDYLGVLDRDEKIVRPFDLPYTSYHTCELQSEGSTVVFVAAAPDRGAAVIAYDVDLGNTRVIRRGLDLDLDPGYISRPEPIEYPTDGDRTAHAVYYPPANKDFTAPGDERPPLIVISHGGPTGSTSVELSMKVQYWTSRGFAVVDVDYGGSTGHGRDYRDRLKGQWGVVDTVDCIRAAQYLVAQELVDGRRMAIRGGSAGGYTALCALVFHDVFSAGASYYGVAELTSLAKDTHKFESRYLDGLIGNFPEAERLYRERSPIHHTEGLSCPVILLQGLEDKVVPPSQAEIMVQALEEKSLSYAYLTFEGEQHGFRRAETVRRATESELYFYSKVFGFDLSEEVEPVEIKNFPS